MGKIPGIGKNDFFYYYSKKKHSWEAVDAYPGGYREETISFVIENRAYVGLGVSIIGNKENGYVWFLHDDFFVFDYEKMAWETQSIKFPGGPRSGAVAFAINNKGYVGTGYNHGPIDNLDDFYEFDQATGWTKIASMDKGRRGAHAFVANGSAYVCFGFVGDIIKFDPKSKIWKKQPILYEEGDTSKLQMFDRSSFFSSFVLNKRGQDFVYTSNGWGYNPRKNIWKKVDYLMHGYMFTIEGQGYSMNIDEKGEFFAKTYKVID